MNFSNNPHSVYNGAISGQRNMFLSSSLAAIIIGFSHNFKNPLIITIVKIIGLCIFSISIMIGLLTNYDFRFYLDKMKGKLPEYIPVDTWYTWSFIVYIYTFLIATIGFLYLIRNIIKK
tara:strand:- start:718 stop:1074 length:357 start_codon:yes stop_codon:yes gene_type:complete